MSFREIEVGDIVHHRNQRWRVTDLYERSPISQRQASLQIIDRENDAFPLWETGVPVHELTLEWRLP